MANEGPLSEVRFLSLSQVAAIMRISKMTVYRLVHSGELEAVRVGRSFRIPEEAVNRYLRAAYFNDDLENLREVELLPIIKDVLPVFLKSADIIDSPILKEKNVERTLHPDFMMPLQDGRMGIVEVKGITPDTQLRLEEAALQLGIYKKAYEEGSNRSSGTFLVLVTPGVLSDDYRQLLQDRGVDQVIDGDDIRDAAGGHVLSARIKEVMEMRSSRSASADRAQGLIKELLATPPGKDAWSRYQTLCMNILEFLFCPPLGKPIPELATRNGVNRRDIIMANYPTDPADIWSHIRIFYRADFVVVDAKNWSDLIDKTEVLKVANYLQSYGAGLFAMIMTRKGCNSAAHATLEEEWRLHQKMIVVLDDSEVEQMLTRHRVGENPAYLIRQKIEDFRLGLLQIFVIASTRESGRAVAVVVLQSTS
jgi:excisionase family DNA binding protein